MALVLALLSVSTIIFSTLIQPLWPKKSEIKVVFVSDSKEGFDFIARNDGQAGGVVHIYLFTVTADGEDDPFAESFFSHQGTFIEPDKPQRIAVPFSANLEKDLCDEFLQSRYFDRFKNFDRNLVTENYPTIEKMGKWFSVLHKPLRCSFQFDQKSFTNESSADLPVTCRTVMVFNNCLARATAGFIE